MKIRSLMIIGAFLALAGCTSVPSGPVSDLRGGRHTVQSGEKATLNRVFHSMNTRDCSPAANPQTTVTVPPRHGSVNRVIAPAVMRSKGRCTGRIGRGVAYQYKSRAGYRGSDSFTVRVRFADGETANITYRLRVQ